MSQIIWLISARYFCFLNLAFEKSLGLEKLIHCSLASSRANPFSHPYVRVQTFQSCLNLFLQTFQFYISNQGLMNRYFRYPDYMITSFPAKPSWFESVYQNETSGKERFRKRREFINWCTRMKPKYFSGTNCIWNPNWGILI